MGAPCSVEGEASCGQTADNRREPTLASWLGVLFIPIYNLAQFQPMPRSHFHFLIHICLLDSEQIMEQKHFGRQ